MSLYEKAVKLAARLSDLDRWCFLTVEDIFEKASAQEILFYYDKICTKDGGQCDFTSIK